ncbi:Na+/H+ antiporter [Xaviernesmea oryzae]|uniref:Na+/H+ antiporter n=1 Tax=Xaviernesmea oryzae TaxID=464029 RepID=A0A1Q9B3J5_9HYPH|nr:Na+/H+ antiporter [Xaviernesmea oryzae]OLP62626.1 Na+/H+ antiporter [Xaviernesmea oryzae]SEM25517.1 sodium/proton antiporter, CPA1 family (TC 2.A.36) [Xaviernesmea oryzae]
MESIAIVLVLLLAVVVSSMLVRLSPVGVPAPLVQIALGAAISVGTGSSITLEPEVFFLLFLPPLLFLDGWRIPKEGLFRDKGVILELALGLVVFTVLGVGLFIHLMIPSMPLPVAFALAAILSPTDPIAVSAIAARVPVPKRLMHILEGESLLNDASGLVCMRFAVAAALTGSFSLTAALGTFVWLALGGVAIGIAVTWAVMVAKDAVSRRIGEDTSVQILISLLIPFAAYLLAEHLGCSGILAAVAAGITMSYVEQRGQVMAATRVRRSVVWDTVQFALNGVIFVILGEQLPGIVAGAAEVVRETGHHDPLWLVVYVVAINLALGILRVSWVWVSLRLTLYRAAQKGLTPPRPHRRLVIATSLAGARGAITLSGILTLPLAMPDGAPFPARDLAIFLAAGVIIVSLVAASVGLPPLLKNLELPPETEEATKEDAARIEAAEAAIRALEARMEQADGARETDAEIGARLLEIYRQRIEGRTKTGSEAEELRRMEAAERQLRLTAIRAEREAIFKASRARRLPDDIARKLIREIDLAEARWGA